VLTKEFLITLPQTGNMKRYMVLLAFLSIFFLSSRQAAAQCSICTKTAQQLGEKPAKGLNTGIIYLAFAPFAIVGFIGYRWWRNNKED